MNSRVNSSKFTNFRNNNITRALNTLAQYLQPMGNAIRFAQTGRNIYRNLIGNGRRRNGYITNSIEINKSDGGRKSVRYNGRTIIQNIEFYAKMRFNPGNNHRYEIVYNNESKQDFNVASALNDNDEFLLLRRQALQYNVLQVAFSFNYNRVPAVKEKWSKLIITPETDLIEISEAKINRNSMVLDMSHNGTKNYSFRITRLNTEPDNAGWIIGQSSFNGIITLHIDSQGDNYSPEYTQEQIETELGEIKITVQVAYRHKDISTVDAKSRTRFTDAEILKEIKEKKLQEINDIKDVE